MPVAPEVSNWELLCVIACLPRDKRLRPILALASAEAVGADPRAAMPAACAIEFIRTLLFMMIWPWTMMIGDGRQPVIRYLAKPKQYWRDVFLPCVFYLATQ